MTARALRVGVVLGGNLVEERLFADANPITLGQSLRCRLSVPADGVPHEHAMFVRDQGRLLLRLTAGMNGRLAQGGTIKTELREGASADGVWTIPLERGARGKLSVGDATILFQEVAAPTKTPRPQLPASVRGTFADRIDRRLALIVGASLLVHIGIGAWAWMTEVEEPMTQTAQVAANYRHETYELTIPEETPAPTQEPGAATPVAPVQTPAPIVKQPRISTSPTPSAPKFPSVDDAQRFAQVLTGNDETGRGRQEMGNRIPGDELDKQIKDIRDNNREIGNDGGGFRTRPREGIGDGRNQIVDGAPSELDQQQPRQERRGERITLIPERGPRDPEGASPDAIIKKIQTAYLPGLKRCYEKGLLDEPTLSGKVKITFTVSETGGVTDPSANGLTKTVDACIATQMASWRFSPAKNKAGEVTDLDVAVTLALASGN